MAWTINPLEIGSAIYAGVASKEFSEEYRKGFEKKLNTPPPTSENEGIGGLFNQAKNFVEEKAKFFSDWLDDDPVGATAGIAAGLLTAGLVLVVGGTVVGAVIPKIGALTAIGKAKLAAAVTTVGGFLKTFKKQILELTGKAIKWVLNATGLGALIRMIVRGTQFIWSFNWNVSDKDIAAQQKQLISNLYSVAGSAVGSVLGTLACGALPAAILTKAKILKINPTAIAQLKFISEFDPVAGNYGELYDEAIENMKALISITANSAAQIMFMEAYKNLRSFIKSTGALQAMFPWMKDAINKWGEDGTPAWSFAIATQNFVQSIGNEDLQEFTEELIESAMEACAESLMIISYQL